MSLSLTKDRDRNSWSSGFSHVLIYDTTRMLLYAMPRCWAPHTQHKCTVYGDDECLSECLSLSLSLCLSVSHSLCVIDNDDDEKMVSYTTRHVYYAMPRCLGPSHFFFFK